MGHFDSSRYRVSARSDVLTFDHSINQKSNRQETTRPIPGINAFLFIYARSLGYIVVGVKYYTSYNSNNMPCHEIVRQGRYQNT
ncbi:hypothetical protein EMPS_03345 [Entomortierella parvispora]|uniref:Uncharacterized protein n=1 Tax=Entomortierella parvispora TaxID=205924 RepID=A0A9P3H6F6_9FUNG|nr:hypothetical protein EMPS_03345 [Entomortierella parvispora]